MTGLLLMLTFSEGQVCSAIRCGGSTLGPGVVAGPQIVACPPQKKIAGPNLWLGPKFVRTIDTL